MRAPNAVCRACSPPPGPDTQDGNAAAISTAYSSGLGRSQLIFPGNAFLRRHCSGPFSSVRKLMRSLGPCGMYGRMLPDEVDDASTLFRPTLVTVVLAFVVAKALEDAD